MTKLKWMPTPTLTHWGDRMLVACVALSKDETADIYVHEAAKDLADEYFSSAEADCQACKEAGFESPGELLAAYKRLLEKKEGDDRVKELERMCGETYQVVGVLAVEAAGAAFQRRP